MNNDERAAFEARLEFTPKRYPSGPRDYMDMSIRTRWADWQAATAAERGACDERFQAMPCYRVWPVFNSLEINSTPCVDRPDSCPRCAAIRARGGSGA